MLSKLPLLVSKATCREKDHISSNDQLGQGYLQHVFPVGKSLAPEGDWLDEASQNLLVFFCVVQLFCSFISLTVFFLLILEIEIDGRSGRHTVVTPGRHLMSSVWCVVLRMLDAVGDFLLELKWRDDLIDKWKEALQALEVVDEGMSRDVSECHRGINLYVLFLTVISCEVTLIQLMRQK